MPSIIVGPIKISAVNDGNVNFGDLFYNSPVSSSKSVTGSGGGNTGDFSQVNNLFSIVVAIDPDVSDSNNVGNV
ncbi:spore germination protein [Pseudalkalibacillus berkeleyi]|uniref:Spore germination protein n=1 Tax=Pseudalkalibacillus berkeleyi TaxID=1069813 RepID=A0ABS9H0D7_9BACL|nr:spore germination protein [Pseudalkalibacillus berkeleyi]MCF6137369.1 spore germination protein [Pseudalkalibacillus berkeleyi]